MKALGLCAIFCLLFVAVVAPPPPPLPPLWRVVKTNVRQLLAGGYGPEQPVTSDGDPVVGIVRQLSDTIVQRIQQKGNGEPIQRLAVLSYRQNGSMGPNYDHYLIKIQTSEKPFAWWVLVYRTKGQPLEFKGLDGPHPIQLPLNDFTSS